MSEITLKKEKLFTITQAANACSVSRSTLLRMEEEGLLTPALHEEGKYRYYSTENVMQALQIYAMHRMGLTHSEIHPLVDSPGDIDAVIARLEHLRDNLDDILTYLKKQTLKDSSTVTEMLRLPETLCYVRTYELEGGRYDLSQYIRSTLTDCRCSITNRSRTYAKMKPAQTNISRRKQILSLSLKRANYLIKKACSPTGFFLK